MRIWTVLAIAHVAVAVAAALHDGVNAISAVAAIGAGANALIAFYSTPPPRPTTGTVTGQYVARGDARD